MLVYRLARVSSQFKYGLGPWDADIMNEFSELDQPQYFRLHGHLNMMPEPFDDGIRGFNGSYYLGCRSLEQLREWFPRVFSTVFTQLDICLFTIEARTVLVGHHQVAFKNGIVLSIEKMEKIYQ